MKQLTILRHGKAILPTGSLEDSKRPLTKGGRKQAKRSAAIVHKVPKPVDLIISSPATRAAQTAEIAAERIGYGGRILWEAKIYDGGMPDLLQLLTLVPEDIEHALLIGHNPGLSNLISALCTGSDNRLCLRLSTGTVAHLHLEIYWWNQLRAGCGELQMLVPPKSAGK